MVPFSTVCSSSWLHFDFVKNNEDQTRANPAGVRSICRLFVCGVLYSDKANQNRIVIPVEKPRFITVDLIEPLRQIDALFAADSGSYARSFPELNEITVEYSDLMLDKLTAILTEQRKHSVQTFEAFSVKFPSEAIARWGIALLLGIQLYFAMHMAAIRLMPGDETSVAWLPLYRHCFPNLFSL